MKRSTLLVVALACVGCANTTTMRIKWVSEKAVVVDSGKDVAFKSLVIRIAPDGSRTVQVEGYSSNANVDVINAQAAREAAITAGAIQAVEAGIRIGAKAATKAVAPLP